MLAANEVHDLSCCHRSARRAAVVAQDERKQQLREQECAQSRGAHAAATPTGPGAALWSTG
eukprot:4061842-Ditylum_brightwellii.AAC.1